MRRSNDDSIRIVLTPEETLALRTLLGAAPPRRLASPQTLILCGLCMALLIPPILLDWLRPELIDQIFNWLRQVPADVVEATNQKGETP